MDGEERRASKRRSLEAGREILAKYKASQGRMDNQATDPSDVDDTPVHNETIDTQNSSMLEDNSCRDTTQSSMSISEGEGEGDIDNMAGRVAELKELLQGKELVIESLSAEINNMRADAISPSSCQSQNSGTQYRDVLASYQNKFRDFEQAIEQRDKLIADLAASLEQTLAGRDALKEKLQLLCSHPVLNQFMQDPKASPTTGEPQTVLQYFQEAFDTRLAALEVEKNEEIKSHKTQINELTQKLQETQGELAATLEETSRMRQQCEEQVEKIRRDMAMILDKFAVETKQKSDAHRREISDLETKHSRELNIFQSQLSMSKKTIEVLKMQLEGHEEASGDLVSLKSQLINAQHERELLLEQIALHKVQVDEITAKYVAAASVFDSKESIERSLEEALMNVAQLKQENENLKVKCDELSAKCSAAHAVIENSQANERSLSSRVYELERSMGRLSNVNSSILSEFNETSYQTFDDLALQIQLSQQKLQEKEELEKRLTERIRNLEESAARLGEEKQSLEKELKDLRNVRDRARSQPPPPELDALQREVADLREKLEKKHSELLTVVERSQQLEVDCKQLMGGLQAAWNQCIEREAKLNESMFGNESRYPDTVGAFNISDASFASIDELHSLKKDNVANSLVCGLTSAFDRYENVFAEFSRVEEENAHLKEEVESLKLALEEEKTEKSELAAELVRSKERHAEEVERLQMQHSEEVEALKAIEGFAKLKEEMERKHAQEMEELRTYFEEKVLHVEKQYSEEIFSQSKRLSEDSSEVEDMTDDLYYGGAGDAEKIRAIPETMKEALKKDKKENSLRDDRNIFTVEQHCQTEMDANLENGELTQLRAAYSVQLEEQVALARRDIVNALQEQIQALLAADDESEENWPSELLQLKGKFTNSSKRELEKLRESHRNEVAKLKEEYAKALQGYESELKRLQVAQLSMSGDLAKEKYENLYKMSILFRGLVGDLVRYIVSCEEELNNTFITELIRRQLAEAQNGSATSEGDHAEIEEPPHKNIVKRVHFAPQSRELSSILNSSTDSLLELVEEEEDIAERFRHELEKCLERVRTESKEIIGVPTTPGESMLDTLSKQVIWTTKVNEELTAKLHEAEGIVEDYEMESKQLKMKIIDLQQKISAIEGTKEIVSEGYGEQDDAGGEAVVLDVAQLLEKARLATVNAIGDSAYHLQLIEELCRCTEKILEDSRRDREDLQQQIDAADKQLKSTRKFLEEQATERELERDEAAKNIKSLQEQLKEKEREKERDLRISSEASLSPEESLVTSKLHTDCRAIVEALESQIRELTSTVSDTEAKKAETEQELKQAVEKIWFLRDLILELERQVQSKTDEIESQRSQLTYMKDVIDAQTLHQQELVEELDNLKSGSENTQLNAHINHLQSELQRHKLSTEQFTVNSAALKQMRSELREMQSHLDKRIKELEALHLCGSNLSISQPSEDVSIRDQIDAVRCPTPEDDGNSPPTLPLDQLLKLKEKLLKHSRTEEVAFKKMKDLDMQLSTLKLQQEELQEERDILQQTTSEQQFQIEQLRGRLEEYKQSAPFAQKQATSRLELQLHEINTKFQNLEQKLADKELELNDVRCQLERTNHLLREKQQELAHALQSEDNVIKELREKLDITEHERQVLETKITTLERAQQGFPQLLDSMLADKNEEIDHLKEKISKQEKQLEALNTVNNDENKPIEPKNSARTLSDIVSIHSECEEVEAIREASNLHLIQNISFRREQQELQKSELLVPPLDLGISPNTTPVHERHVSTRVDSAMSGLDLRSPLSVSDHERSSKSSPQPAKTQKTIQDLENKLKDIHEELKSKTSTLNKREVELHELKKSLDELRAESKDSIETLTRDKDFYKNQYELSQESEKKIRRDLEEVENFLKLKSEELDVYKEKIQENERILVEATNETAKLNSDIVELRELNATFEAKLIDKMEELQNLKEIILGKDITIETLQTRNMEIENENKQLYEFKTKFEALRRTSVDTQNEIQRLTDGINSRDLVIQRLEEMARRSSFSSPENSNRDQELYHLRELVKEKEKIIQQMTDDSKSLHRELETVHRKMKEPGNVVELRKKLQQEKKYNAELTKMVTKLSKELEVLKEDSFRVPENNDLEDMVQRELDLSADLDKKIMDAIESESEELSSRRIEMHSCNSLTIKPVAQDLEKIMEQYVDIRARLKKQNKLNEELQHQKNELEIEREMLNSQLREYENRVLQLKSDYDVECRRNSALSEELSSKKAAVRNLEVQIRKEKTAHQNSQLEDSNLIEMLRIKLSAAMNIEEQLRTNYNALKERNRLLTSQLQNLKFQIESQRNPRVVAVPPPELPAENADMGERLERTMSENAELRTELQTLERERDRYRRELEIMSEESEKLQSSLAIAESEREHLEIVERRLTETVKARDEEIEWLQKKIKNLTDAEEKRQQQRKLDQTELKNLREEIKNVREVMNDWQIDTDQMREQLKGSLAERAQMTQVVLTLRKTEEELNKKLNEAKVEEERLREVISDLKGRLSIERVLQGSRSPRDGQFVQEIRELTEKIERYADEKGILHEKLMKERQEKEKCVQKIRDLERVNVQKNFDDSELSQKFQHLYGKYIRVDSKRKALAFQKRYLLCVIGGYQLSEENTLSILAQLTNSERCYANYEDRRKRAKVRLRSVGLVVISIIRMQWLVSRWRSGNRRATAGVVVSPPDRAFVPIQRGPEHSPPVREKRLHNGTGINYEHYLERITSIQETLGLVMGHTAPPNQ